MTSNAEIVMIMGYPAIGKSRHAQEYVEKGYVRLNRDLKGGSLDDLVKIMDEQFKSGQEQFVLDNTYVNKTSRAPVIDWGKEHDIPVKLIWITAPPKKKGVPVPEAIEIAQYNAAKRMILKYGKLLTAKELKEAKDPNMFPPAALFAYRNKFEKPTKDEGFESIEVIRFERDIDSSIYKNKALILDYDGTLRITKSGEKYPQTPEDVEILDNRTEVLKEYQEKGYLLLGISNQSFVGKGTITHEDAAACFERTNELLGIEIDYRFCPHASFPINCYCRKPMPGLGALLIEEYKLDPEQTIMIGDQTSDKTFARRCGIKFKHADDFFIVKARKETPAQKSILDF